MHYFLSSNAFFNRKGAGEIHRSPALRVPELDGCPCMNLSTSLLRLTAITHRASSASIYSVERLAAELVCVFMPNKLSSARASWKAIVEEI